MKCVVSVLGKDRSGIVAEVATALAECGANIDDISQTILDDIFSMTMLTTLDTEKADFNTVQERLAKISDDLGMQIIIQREFGLVEQPISTCTAWLSAGVQPHPGFTHPNQQRANQRSQTDSRVRDAGTRLQHEARNRSNRNVSTHAILVDDYERTIEYVDLTVLDEDHGNTIFHREWLERR